MSLLERVIRAHRCRSTHHHIALDAMALIDLENQDAWKRLFLVHHEHMLAGAKAPDAKFKDFKNHVLHVSEGRWGGAPGKAMEWYARSVELLSKKKWSEAAFALGVLSHYYADPIQPFHTGQTEEEGVIHRAVEWSIAKSRPVLDEMIAERGYPTVEAPTGQGFVADMVVEGAEMSHAHYQTFIDHYNLDAGVIDPPAGLDDTMREAIADLIAYATAGFATLVTCAIQEAAVAPPKTNLTIQGYIETLDIPLRWVTAKLSDASDRRQVERMYNEFQKTGKVVRTLPDDDKAIRRLHAQQVLRIPLKTLDRQPIEPIGTAHVAPDGTIGEVVKKTKVIEVPEAVVVTPSVQEKPKKKPKTKRPKKVKAKAAAAVVVADEMELPKVIAPPPQMKPVVDVAEVEAEAISKAEEEKLLEEMIAAEAAEAAAAEAEAAERAATDAAEAEAAERAAIEAAEAEAAELAAIEAAEAEAEELAAIEAAEAEAEELAAIDAAEAEAVELAALEAAEAEAAEFAALEAASQVAEETTEDATAEDENLEFDAEEEALLEELAALEAAELEEAEAAAAAELAAQEPYSYEPEDASEDDASDADESYAGTRTPGLKREDSLVDAPSIGRKTAKRLAREGLTTVADLVDCDAEETAYLLDINYIDAQTLTDWQDQAKLMMTVPGLRGHDAQVLVGSGIRTPEELSAASARSLFLMAMEFLSSPEGEGLQREDEYLAEDEVEEWIGLAREAA